MSTLYQTVTDTIVAALERGVVPWRKPWDTNASLPVNAVTNRHYRGVNVLLLSLSPYIDHRWLTFRQARERGGRVRSGERSTLVVFWKQFEVEEGDDGKRNRRPPILRHYHAFNVEQCDGLIFPEVYKPRESENARIERADLLVNGMPDPPRIEEGKCAWYRPGDDLIQVPPIGNFRSSESYYATLFHELAHATGHEKRLARAGVTSEVRFGSGEYSKEELVAELTSAFCCATVGLDNSFIEESAAYVAGWLGVLKADAKSLIVAAAQAQRAADYIKNIRYQ